VNARPLCLILMTLVAWPGWAADAGLGRLFFTPAQRQALEEARRKNVRAEVQAAEKPARPPVRNVTVSGVVRRSDGESTVWVNGKPVDGTTEDGLKVRVTAGQQGAVIVYEPEKDRTLRLKVGQRADILTGRIEEGYERREAAVPPAELPALPAPAQPPGSNKPGGPTAESGRDNDQNVAGAQTPATRDDRGGVTGAEKPNEDQDDAGDEVQQ
jgi:hypothetical protein